MAQLNKGESEERPRFSLLPEETTEDTVVCILDWLKETVQTPKRLAQSFDLIIATIQERNRLQEEKQAQSQAQNQVYKAQIQELIEERDQFQHKLLQALHQQATTRESTPQPQTASDKSTKIPDLLLLTDRKSPTFSR